MIGLLHFPDVQAEKKGFLLIPTNFVFETSFIQF